MGESGRWVRFVNWRLVFACAVVLTLCALSAVAIHGWRISSALDLDRTALVDATRAVAECKALRTALVDLELGYRGYRFTGDKRALNLYSLAKMHVRNRLASLQGSELSKSHRKSLANLDQQVKSIIKECDNSIAQGEASAESYDQRAHLERVLQNLDHFASAQILMAHARMSEVELGSHQMSLVVWTMIASIAICCGLFALAFCAYRRACWRADQLVRRNAELERDVAKRIFHNAPIGIARLHADLTIRDTNQLFRRYLRHEASELTGRRLTDFLPGLAQELERKVVGCRTTYGEENCKIENPELPDWQHVHWNVWAWPIFDDLGGVRELVLLVLDVSERVKLTHERDDLYAAIAHDLRVPLLGADRVLELLLTMAVSESQRSELLSKLRESNARMLSEITNLLELSRYANGMGLTQAETFDLSILIKDLISDLAPLADKLAVSLDTNINGGVFPVHGDREAIRRLLVNLVDNALKFTAEGGQVHVHAFKRQDEVALEVVDNGCGISLEVQKHLFQRFWRGVPGRYHTASIGFGLYLCRMITEMHHGTIECKSNLEQGTTFRVTIPSQVSEPVLNALQDQKPRQTA